MFTYKLILVPVDGSSASQLGLRHAISVAKPMGARIRLLNVVDELSIIPAPVDAYAAVNIAEMIAALKEGGQKVLEESAALAMEWGVDAEQLQLESHGQPVSKVILDDARQSRADLIAMGTHGRRGITRLLLGSDAERVMREASVPVLLVRGEEKER
jgi:nucleotide-binding universal stress UspA family protein